MVRAQRGRRTALRRAFTLMEVLVVVAILVVLAGIGVVVFRYLDESKEKVAYMGIRSLEDAASAYKISNGDYPESLVILTEPLDGKPAVLEEKNLIDPWGRAYIYEPQTRNPKTGKPRIYSQGVNPGNPGGVIANWK